MAWTNTNFYITMIFASVVVFSGLALIGTDLINSDRNDVNEKSLDYISQIKGVNDDSGYDGITETSRAQSEGTGILDDLEDNATVSDTADFLSTLYIKKERANKPTNFLKVAYNTPSNLLSGIGLPVSDFKWIINILAYILVIALVILVWTRWIRT